MSRELQSNPFALRLEPVGMSKNIFACMRTLRLLVFDQNWQVPALVSFTQLLSNVIPEMDESHLPDRMGQVRFMLPPK